MEIDVLDAVRALLLADPALAALVGDRVATKHRFHAGGWEIPGKAVVVRYTGGEAETYVRWQRPRLEFRCYGESAREAGKVYNALSDLTRAATRRVVTTGGGDALVYYLVLTSGPSLLYDPDVDVDMVLVFAEAAVAEQSVS
jgi:hypothetical protein